VAQVTSSSADLAGPARESARCRPNVPFSAFVVTFERRSIRFYALVSDFWQRQESKDLAFHLTLSLHCSMVFGRATSNLIKARTRCKMTHLQT
jgi:hypothetical protein